MKYFVKINSVKTIDEIEGSWNNADYTELLKRFGFTDAEKIKPNELREYLFMAISDFEPSEAAAILLDYKLSEVLTEGQIDNLSNDMLREKVSENYSDMFAHKFLFNINQLLYKAYNGKFPHTKATFVEFEMKEEHEEETEITKELILKALRPGLTDSNLINRLFSEQLEGNAPFPEAEDIIWELHSRPNFQYSITASEKWLKQEDFSDLEFESNVTLFIGKSGDE